MKPDAVARSQDDLAQAILELQRLNPLLALQATLEELDRARLALPHLAEGPEWATSNVVRDRLAGINTTEDCKAYSEALILKIINSEQTSYSDLEQAQREYTFCCYRLALAAVDPEEGRLDFAALEIAEAYGYHPTRDGRSAYSELTSRFQERIDALGHRQAEGPRLRNSLLSF